MNSHEPPESFVVTFFHTADGTLHCRVINVCTKEQWIAPDPGRLRASMQKRTTLVSSAAT